MKRAVMLVIAVAISLACTGIARADITFSVGPVDPIIVRSGDPGPYTARLSGFASDTGNVDLSILCMSTTVKAELTVHSGTSWTLDLEVPFGSSTIACMAGHPGSVAIADPVTVSIDILVAIAAPLTVRVDHRGAIR